MCHDRQWSNKEHSSWLELLTKTLVIMQSVPQQVHSLFRKKILHLNFFNFHGTVHRYMCILYRVSQEEWTKLRKIVPCVELYRYNPKHLYPKLNGYGDNGQRSLKL